MCTSQCKYIYAYFPSSSAPLQNPREGGGGVLWVLVDLRTAQCAPAQAFAENISLREGGGAFTPDNKNSL